MLKKLVIVAGISAVLAFPDGGGNAKQKVADNAKTNAENMMCYQCTAIEKANGDITDNNNCFSPVDGKPAKACAKNMYCFSQMKYRIGMAFFQIKNYDVTILYF